jgi:hypothetical protein
MYYREIEMILRPNILYNIVVYLPHARNAEPQNPRNTHATIDLQNESTRC